MVIDEGDENEGNEEEDGSGGDTEEDEPAQMSVDEDENEDEDEDSSRKKKKKSQKLRPRKSQLDINATLESSQAALAHYSSQEITQRRLQKKFCRDALTFIDEVERAMEPMMKLLGSTNKAEVLEVMDFFRVACEYGFESAKVSVVVVFFCFFLARVTSPY